jgi:serine/threonine-protein kinase
LAVITGGSACYSAVIPTGVETDSAGGAKADDPEAGPDGGSTGGAGPGGQGAGCDDYEQLAQEMLETSCSGCHGPGGAAPGGFADATDVEAMISEGLVVPGDAGGSLIFTRVDDGTMPPASAPVQPSSAQIQALEAWIDECLPQAQCSHDDFITLEQMLTWMRDDIRDLDPDDRAFIRYLVITDIYNTGLCGDALDLDRYAMWKALNSLSKEVDLVTPTAIDPEQTIYRIDLRDYGWTAALWESIVAQSPYSVAYDFDEARDLSADTQCDVPFLLSNNFVVDAVQPPLYHEILDLPQTRLELEADLGVDVALNIANEDVDRAGFGDSGVSVNNRIIERHVLPSSGTRVYWLSYDFASNAQDSNIFSNPLSFQEAGNEVIFSLPNGLHGYMIVDGFGGRLDEAPDDIVTDPSSPNGNVRNGLSCMNCHAEGIIEHEDALRDHVLEPTNGFPQATQHTVEALHPENPALMAIKAIDRDNYADALTLIGVPTDLPTEPVNAIFRDFDDDVDLVRAAAELGIPVEVLQAQLGGLSEDLQPLANGPIKREVFTVNFAQAICDLNLGSTNACGSLGDGGSTDGEGTGGLECDPEEIPPFCFEAQCLPDPVLQCGCPQECFAGDGA